jgi:hypothetical protein
MTNLLPLALLAIFLIHLVAFSVLGLRRRQGYYIALVATFFLLSLSIAVRLWWPHWTLGESAVFELLRFLAWAAAAVSIGWTLSRVIARRRSKS